MTPDISAIAQKFANEYAGIPMPPSLLARVISDAIEEATASLRAQLAKTDADKEFALGNLKLARERVEKLLRERDAAISAIGPTERKLVAAEATIARFEATIARLDQALHVIANGSADVNARISAEVALHPLPASPQVAQESPLNGKEPHIG